LSGISVFWKRETLEDDKKSGRPMIEMIEKVCDFVANDRTKNDGGGFKYQ